MSGICSLFDSAASLVHACTTGDLSTVKQLLEEGGSVHETSEEGESLLSLACSAGYFGLAKVCFWCASITKIILNNQCFDMKLLSLFADASLLCLLLDAAINASEC